MKPRLARRRRSPCASGEDAVVPYAIARSRKHVETIQPFLPLRVQQSRAGTARMLTCCGGLLYYRVLYLIECNADANSRGGGGVGKERRKNKRALERTHSNRERDQVFGMGKSWKAPAEPRSRITNTAIRRVGGFGFFTLPPPRRRPSLSSAVVSCFSSFFTQNTKPSIFGC